MVATDHTKESKDKLQLKRIVSIQQLTQGIGLLPKRLKWADIVAGCKRWNVSQNTLAVLFARDCKTNARLSLCTVSWCWPRNCPIEAVLTCPNLLHETLCSLTGFTKANPSRSSFSLLLFKEILPGSEAVDHPSRSLSYRGIDGHISDHLVVLLLLRVLDCSCCWANRKLWWRLPFVMPK